MLSQNFLPSFTVVVPAFNEEAGLPSVFAGLQTLRSRWPADIEIILVDDGSTDRTAEIAMAAGARVLRNPSNFGYGTALARGIAAASHEVIATIDGDGSYAAEDLELLARELCRGFDMVVGVRSGPHYRGWVLKRVERAIFRAMGEFVIGRSIPDINSGLRVFRREVVMELLPQISKGFSFSTSLTIILPLRGHHIAFRPVQYNARRGKSKVRLLRDSLQATQILVETVTFYNPLKLFLLIQALLWLLAIGFGIAYYFAREMVWGLAAIVLFAEGVLAFTLGLLALGNLRR